MPHLLDNSAAHSRCGIHSTNRTITRQPSNLALLHPRAYPEFVRRPRRRNHGDIEMAWKTPKIVEVSVGMEINMYVCAKLK
jgi:coenzyme PQQ precursor peptide PqqA